MNRKRRHWILIAGVAVAIGSAAALGQAAITRAIDATLPDARGINRFKRPGTINLLSSNGQVIQKLGPATREKIKPGQMPQLVTESFIAAEDRRFYEHNGVDLWGVGRAIVTNLRQGSVREGEWGQQVAELIKPKAAAHEAEHACHRAPFLQQRVAKQR